MIELRTLGGLEIHRSEDGIRRGLGIEPSEETKAYVRAIRTGR